ARQLLNQGGEPTPSNAVTDSANRAADWIQNKTGFDPRSIGQAVTGWVGADATQYGQSVKRPQATKAGAQLLGWMAPMMGKLEALYNLPAGLLRSVALTESGGNQFAVSGAGAQGLFQFMPGTARDMGLRGNDVFDPIKSAEAAARYLSMLLQKNGGDLNKTL
ncbi:lytic transglycosylase, partial [Klebsiella pneumoniae]